MGRVGARAVPRLTTGSRQRAEGSQIWHMARLRMGLSVWEGALYSRDRSRKKQEVVFGGFGAGEKPRPPQAEGGGQRIEGEPRIQCFKTLGGLSCLGVFTLWEEQAQEDKRSRWYRCWGQRRAQTHFKQQAEGGGGNQVKDISWCDLYYPCGWIKVVA